MTTNNKPARILNDVKIKLAALWGSLMLLYIYADILSLFRPGELQKIMEGNIGQLPVALPTELFVDALLMIIPSMMVFLSVTMKPVVNRWTNIVLGIFYTLVNIGNLMGETWAYYITFGIVEIVITLLIIGYAWKWREVEDQN